MTAYEKLLKLQELVAGDALSQARARQKLAEQLGKTVQALRDSDQEVKALRDLSKVCGDCSVLLTGPDLRSCLGELKTNLGELRAQLLDSGSAIGLGLWNTNGQRVLRQKSRRITELAKAAWENGIQAEFGKYWQLGDLLSKVRATNRAGIELKSDANDGLHLGRSFPPDSRTLLALKKCRDKVSKRSAELEGVGLTPKVREFLKAAVAGSATIEQCTDSEVIEWVAKAGAATSFKVSLA